MSNPLEALVVDGEAVVRQKIAAALTGRIGLEPNRDAVHLLVANGSARERVTLALLGQMALAILKPGTAGRLHPRQISDLTGVNPGTVRPTLMKLVQERLIAADDDGAYAIPIAQLDRAIGIATRAPEKEAA